MAATATLSLPIHKNGNNLFKNADSEEDFTDLESVLATTTYTQFEEWEWNQQNKQTWRTAASHSQS